MRKCYTADSRNLLRNFPPGNHLSRSSSAVEPCQCAAALALRLRLKRLEWRHCRIFAEKVMPKMSRLNGRDELWVSVLFRYTARPGRITLRNQWRENWT